MLMQKQKLTTHRQHITTDKKDKHKSKSKNVKFHLIHFFKQSVHYNFCIQKWEFNYSITEINSNFFFHWRGSVHHIMSMTSYRGTDANGRMLNMWVCEIEIKALVCNYSYYPSISTVFSKSTSGKFTNKPLYVVSHWDTFFQRKWKLAVVPVLSITDGASTKQERALFITLLAVY